MPQTTTSSEKVSQTEKRGSEAPDNKTIGNIHTLTLKEYLPERYDFLRLRVKFLGWEVDVELLEMFAGAAVWIVFVDIINLIGTKANNSIYDLLFVLLPPISWIVIAGSIGFIHLIALLIDRSSEPNYDMKEDKGVNLRIRVVFMALAFLFNFCITASIFAGHTYALSWKLMALLTFAAFFSHIRLRKYLTRLSKKQRKQDIAPNTSK